jgi:hypothetical protein
MQLCEDLGVEISDIVMVALSWKMGAEAQGNFLEKEWITGCQKLEADTIEKLKDAIPALRAALADKAEFRLIYKFAFNWSKEMSQRGMEIDMAKGMYGGLVVFGCLIRKRVGAWACVFVYVRSGRSIGLPTSAAVVATSTRA